MQKKRDFLSLWDVTAPELRGLLMRAAVLKDARLKRRAVDTLRGRSLGMIFEKASTRTRVSFEIAACELGAHAVYLTPEGSQIGRGEPVSDTARVLGAYCHGLVIRTFAQARAAEFAQWAPVPVINGLTDYGHPCQVVADLFTVQEVKGAIDGLRYAWIGDGNNMAHSWMQAAALLGLDLVLACPKGYEPDPELIDIATHRLKALGKGSIKVVHDPLQAADGADVVSTDVWASMGQEDEAERRKLAFNGYRVDEALMARTRPKAVVLHCLPAHRGEEISAEVLEGPQAAVWRQAENRLHTQKAILELFLGRRG